jgi:hypothetical protein
MEAFFGLLFLAMIVASFWGGVVLSIRLVKHWLARVVVGILLVAVFVAAGATAVIAGCTAVVGPPNFH